MYSLLAMSKLSLNGRLIIQNFIEKLSGPVIGFYCYDMFAVETYQFYDFVMGWISNYFLIIELYNHVMSITSI